ncbi:MAG: ComF family protein [Ruminococcus sp.]|nr:ComF family protein [Ruminococcus sp.]
MAVKRTRRPLYFDFLLDLFFPMRCPVCDKVIGWNKRFCSECESKLEYAEPVPWQAVFHAKIGEDEPEFDRAEALFRYEGTARKAVLSLKYRGSRAVAEYTAERLPEKLFTDGLEPWDIDIVIPVPMNIFKRLRRGYNQAELFARELSRESGIRLETGYISHRRKKVEQHKLSWRERLSSAKSTYCIRGKYAGKKPLAGKCVMLCDDIFTSGATVNSCAKLLKELGAEKVIVAVICYTPPKEDTVQKNVQ